jgi:uncharacterized protein (TIGR00255 family)
MIRSMTGYGRSEVSGARLAVSVECRSVNQRHLDVVVKLPRGFAPFEAEVRRVVQGALHRGRIEVSVTLTPAAGMTLAPLTVNTEQAREYAKAAKQLADDLSLPGGPRLEWLLGQPGVLTREEPATVTPEEAWPLLEHGIGEALRDLVGRREAEGRALAREMSEQHAALSAHVAVMTRLAPAAVERRSARLRERVQALLGETPLDEGRLAMEVGVWAERADIAEELARLRAHLDAVAALLERGGPVGRALDFLVQEINREVNTVGSKADDLAISQAVIAAKSALEKLREQAQNLE